MTSSMKSGIVGCIVGCIVGMAIMICLNLGQSRETIPAAPAAPAAPAPAAAPAAAPMPPEKRAPVPKDAVDRVVSRSIKGEFGLTGRGESAKWGIAEVANFKYTVIAVVDSEILSREKLPEGEIKVTEIRTFTRVQDSIVVSDVDMKLALDTLPVKVFSSAIDVSVTLWTAMTGDTAGSAAVLSGKNYVMEKLKDVDGKGIRSLLGSVCIKPPAAVEAEIDQFMNARVRKALGGIRSISGKSYKITYYQKATGQPLYVKITYHDDSEVTDEEEQLVLKRVNSFIDHNMVPNKDCAPGDDWLIPARDMQEVFDPYVRGTYLGSVRAVRKANFDNGKWNIQLSPSVIEVIDDNGNTNGHLSLERGHAVVDPKLISVDDLVVQGRAKLEKVSKHHWLFAAKISGECDFQGRIVTTPKK